MSKKNFSECHIRIFNSEGIIYQADPNMDAYELVHALIDLQRDQTVKDPQRQLKLDIDKYLDVGYWSEWLSDVKIYTDEQKIKELDELTDRLRRFYSEDLLKYYLDLSIPTLNIPANDVSEDIVRIKILMNSMGVTHYTGLKQAAIDGNYGDIEITLKEGEMRGFTETLPPGTNYDQVRRDIEALYDKYQNAADPEIVAMQEAELDWLERCN